MISKKRQEMRVSTSTCTGKNNSAEVKDPRKKQLNFENPEPPALFDKEMEAIPQQDTPVDRMLSKKPAGVEGATMALEHAKVQKNNFERELSRAAFHNSGSLSMCGKCHFKVGHTKRNCDGDECTSAMLCGVIDKHPNDKAVRRNLSQQVTKCEAELANLQSDYNSKLRAY